MMIKIINPWMVIRKRTKSIADQKNLTKVKIILLQNNKKVLLKNKRTIKDYTNFNQNTTCLSLIKNKNKNNQNKETLIAFLLN